MKRNHVIGPTSADHYPIATVAGWMALWSQGAMERRRAHAPHVAARNAVRFWSTAESQGLVIQ
jgi:hypothetical protein